MADAVPGDIDAADAALATAKTQYNDVAAKWNDLSATLNPALQNFRDVGVDPASTVAAMNAVVAQINPGGIAIKGMIDAVAAKKGPKPGPTAPDYDNTWAARSLNRLLAIAMASSGPEDANLAARHRAPPNNPQRGLWVPDEVTYTKPVIDNLGLRFDIETGKGAADYFAEIPAFGANSRFRMQWQLLFNESFIDTVFRMTGGGYPGIKLGIVSQIERSSPWNKIVVSTMDQHKFPFVYGYDENGNTKNIQPAIGNPPTDFDWQPKQGQPPTCLYSTTNATPQGQAVPGCETLVAWQWITLDLEVDTFDAIPGTNTWDWALRLYMTVGNGRRKLVIDYGKTSQGYAGRNAEALTGVWLVPYMTGRDIAQTFPKTPSVWMRRVIIDNKSIIGEQEPVAQSIDMFAASKTSILRGESVDLTWIVANATEARLDGAKVPSVGTKTVSPTADETHTLEADGAAATLSRAISIAVSDPPVGGGTLPSFVPNPGSFAEFTTNTPTSVGTPVSMLANWTGGTFNDDFGAMGGALYHGGGEHFSWPDKGGVLVLDCAARAYMMRCVPTNQTHMGIAGTSGSVVNDYGEYADDGYPQSKHTYNGLVPFPRDWGGGPQGGLLRLQSGGPLNTEVPYYTRPDGVVVMRTHGWAAAHAFDLSQLRDGHSRLTVEQTIDLGSGRGCVINDAPGAGIDWMREGWWLFARTGGGQGDRMAFIHKSGRVDPPGTSAIGLNWGRLTHFADDDTLVAIATGINICHPGQTNPWKSVAVDVAADDLADWNASINYLGYPGFQWCSILNCWVGMDARRILNADGAVNTRAVRIWKITPPDTAEKRWTDKWRVERELIVSADGSEIDGGTDHAVNAGNGLSYGKLVECKALRSLVWTRRTDRLGQLIRLRGM